MTTGLDLLSVAIKAPHLPGAACKGKGELFDPRPASDPHRLRHQRQAVRLCRHCPALRDCSDWLDTLPVDEWPAGVIAGRVVDGRRTYRNPAKLRRGVDRHAS